MHKNVKTMSFAAQKFSRIHLKAEKSKLILLIRHENHTKM